MPVNADMPSNSSALASEPIAIVGSSCRFAGDASSPSKLWELLSKPRDVRSEIPESRFNAKGFYHKNPSQHGHMNVLHSYLLNEDLRVFDAEFFGINPVEARAMDPQQRMLLEIVYEAIESAGLSIEGLRGSDTGVYAGLMCGDYEAMLLRDLDQAPTYFAVGTSRAVLSNRVSYFFDWHGASVTIDTACSSSLVAVHQAVRALRAGDSKMAVACGSNLILGPEMYIIESKLKMLSPDGLSRMWDADANGYARGDGVAAVVLKTLSQALRDGDRIEAIIRETGVNQDGATPGLTMPSASAQRALIHSVYKKAGLDPENPSHWPQYIEAHGTGTPAGDPVEAEALSSAFFGAGKEAKDGPIYTGSIKTVLGHTEGTAGIAALLKGVKAMQNSTVPPNLLFNRLNPAVAPFYGNIQIATQPLPWPTVAPGQPKRVSLNNFGFGGTNAHAILESYVPPGSNGSNDTSAALTPFVFSAASEESLRANLSAYVSYIDSHPETNVRDLAYTLRERRSILPYRVSFSATSLEDLGSKIRARLDNGSSDVLGVRTWAATSKNKLSSKVMGVFTGQGAQYARMGAELIESSPFARGIIEKLDNELSQLPDEDRPDWTMLAELLAEPSASRIGDAAVSQPLCTAIQIMMVDILRAAGVQFHTVIGHSSGEIAAAYAARFLTARDAIVIAYYRGLHCKRAASPNGVKGAMLAAGTSAEDAAELCEDEDFAGRLGIAAVNSSSSVTISGDEDAIAELEVILEDEKKFNRRLRVDVAYHSKHMLPCFDPYVASLQRAGVKALPGDSRCTWFSSVFNGRPIESGDKLSDAYWAENMTRPVLFAQAVQAAASATVIRGDDTPAVALEVGPHPALAGPALQNISETLQKKIPYHGTLQRGGDATSAVSDCLGFLWMHLDKASVSLSGCDAALLGYSQQQRQFTVLGDLPSYQWKHETAYWAESRRSRRMRLRDQTYHQLLGNLSPDSAAHILRWKNVLKPSEMPWLEGHQVQGQIVLPAAAYVSTAVEAARSLSGGKTIRLIELSNFNIHNAITFDQGDACVEIQIELSQVSVKAKHVTATFTYSAALGGDSADLALAADGKLRVSLCEDSDANDSASAPSPVLPERRIQPPHMIPVDSSRLYGFMAGLEYNFSGAFRSLVKLERKLGRATCVANKARTSASAPDADDLLIHPVDLDAAFQSVMLAYSYPGDDRLRLLHLPSSIDKVRIDPAALASRQYTDEDTTLLDSMCPNSGGSGTANGDGESSGGFSGCVSIYTSGLSRAAIQVDQVRFKPVGASDASNDRDVFYKMHWVPSQPDGSAAAANVPVTDLDRDLVFVLSRIAAFYLRQFDDTVPQNHPARSESPLCHYLNYAQHMTNLLKRGEHKWAYKEWLKDTEQDVLDHVRAKGVMDNSDVRIMLLVGKTMPRVFRGETTMLEHFRTSGLLDEYYANGFGTKQSTMWVGSVIKQLTNRNPHLNILEIGAGTGGATKRILDTIGHDFNTYTFTDISSSFFENAAETFSGWSNRMIFKVCNAEDDPVAQGFKPGTYDVVVAFMVVHACARLGEAVANLRKLLKPGGMLILGEGAGDGAMQAGAGFIFGPLPGWWRGVEEGRTLSPLVDTADWEVILRNNGFSGVDTMSPPRLFDAFGITLFVSTAVDDRIQLARDPLTVTRSTVYDRVIILGGQTTKIAALADGISDVLKPFAKEIIAFKSLEQLDETVLDTNSVVLSLVDLETPVFKDVTPERWYNFRKLFEGGKDILWLTSGRLQDEPYCNMTVGFGRSAMHEDETLRVQYLDVPDASKASAQLIAQYLLRFTSKQLDASDILFVKEPEIIIDDQGRELVPRLFPIADANDRLNSDSRSIFREVDSQKSVVEMQQQNSGSVCLRQLSRYETAEGLVPYSSSRKTIKLRVTHAVSSALRSQAGYHFLVLGVDEAGARHVSLVTSLTSVLKAPVESTVRFEVPDGSETAQLLLVAAELSAMTVVDSLLAGQKLVAHNATDVVAEALISQALSKGVNVTLTTDSEEPSSSAVHQLKLPSYLERSEVAEMLPRDVACFVAYSTGIEPSETELTMMSVLPPYCRREDKRTMYSPRGVEIGSPGSLLGQTLQRAIASIKKHSSKGHNLSSQVKSVNIEALANGELLGNPLAIIDWTPSSASLCARVARFESKQLFKSNKTYWLVGLSGALGISLFDWMIERGVRHLVITSRNPKIDRRWVEDHQRCGVNIHIMPCDVTDEEAIRAVHQRIVDTLPPIVGLLNGAMVLRDVSVRNMQFDQVTDVTRPKVLGSIHLDRIFHDVDLDFFVLLSSINCVIGNVGQANYAAANMGMIGVAGNRRKRGLRSSVVNVGAIIGIGYITQSERQLDVTVAKTAMMHLSEQDFHQIFAECMEAGHLDNPNGPEISTGLLPITSDMANIPPWYHDPKFTRFLVQQSISNGDGKQEKTNSASIQDLLRECRSRQEVLQVVKEAYGTQLRRMLQVSTGDDDLMMMRGVELGFDSLLSVDVRSWFLKNFQVSVPVLKIMANDVRMSSLVDLAVEGIPSELVPQLQQDGPQSPNPNSSGSSSSGEDSSSVLPKSTGSNDLSSGVTTPPESTFDVEPKVTSSLLVEWTAETTPPEPDTSVPDLSSAPAPKANPEVVLLTGCSGLLGHHLLNSLLAQPSVRKIICVAVRRLPERLETKRLPSAGGRVVYHEGDLSQSRFGLREDEWADIFGEVDAVIHNGSDTSHLKYYSALRQANVESTRQLVGACLRRMVPFHYVSSAGVALFAGLEAFPPTSCTGTGKTPPADGAHGYMCGKWTCERMLERLMERHPQLRVVVQRPSTIIREGDDAETDEAGLDWVNSLLHYAHKTRTVPRVEYNAGAFDLVSIETCCDDVIRELLRDTVKCPAKTDKGITFVNNVGDIIIPMSGMAEIGLRQTGKKYDVLPMEQWTRAVVAAGMHPAVAALIETFDEPGVDKYPRLLREVEA
ncbi:hypothetical protein CkaCkLH20_10022 [Colletotrichum karsti]|uniref:Uncharacterized protein n=1 Tax=Colletotrichum karsti TaxID=1095194 RepID=A0A9P6HYJ3_9PEZI|nr:uncharacterized protein CkaCkLH20_10022 [Colletotrichum karsti]KAF9872525.1 hypothetical protein CkaCkLH20_10022 [Colletotrichum karsti]